MTALRHPPLAPGALSQSIPPLENGDHLSRREFLRRYQAMPEVKKAELIDGVVYMPSPVRINRHGKPHSHLIAWLATYSAATVGTEVGDNSTVELDVGENCPQPDGLLRILPEYGGQSRTTEDDYVAGTPELGAEIASSSVSYDLHEKLQAFERNRMQEYLVWRVSDQAIDWFRLRDRSFQPLSPDAAGLVKSEVFPGLWLDVPALIRGDLAQVLATLQQGVASPEHQAFVAELQKRRVP